MTSIWRVLSNARLSGLKNGTVAPHCFETFAISLQSVETTKSSINFDFNAASIE